MKALLRKGSFVLWLILIGSALRLANAALPLPPSPVLIKLQLMAYPARSGTVSGEGTYPMYSTQTISATPNPGWAFDSWSDGNKNSTRTLYVSGTSQFLIAHFVRLYTIRVSAWPVGGGAVSGGQVCKAGAVVTVVATAAGGYTFLNWTETGAVVTNSAIYQFTVSTNRTLVANFQGSGPRLVYTRTGDTLALRWSLSEGDFILEATDVLDTSQSWTPVASAPETDGADSLVQQQPLTDRQRFYRLRRP